MRSRLAVASLLTLALGNGADAQMEPPNGFNPGIGLSFRHARYKTPLQTTGVTFQVAAAKSIGTRSALRLELGAAFFDMDEFTEFSSSACIADPQCDAREGREAMVIGSALASLWIRPLPLQRLYVVGGAGVFAVSMTSNHAESRPGGMTGLGYVFNPDAKSPWSIEVRYIKFRSSHDSLAGLIPIVFSIQF